MADIARLAGVSMATVSRALSGNRGVGAETRARIEDLARSLNYAVNVGAQNLRLKQNHTVAVIVPFDAISREHLSDPFFLSLIGSIADALTHSGYDMLLSRIDSERLDLAAHTIENGRTAAAILIGQWHSHDQLNAMAQRGVPFVVWGSRMARQLYATVGTDNLHGGHLAATHLLDQGARHIAFIGDPGLPEIAQRQAGYLRAHQDRGLEPDPRLMRTLPFLSERIRADLEALLASGTPLDGIVAGSDLCAMSAINTLRHAGRRVPGDVAVVGYDDIALAAHFNPALTTVRQPIAQAGRALVNSVMAMLAGHRPASVILPTELVQRESSRPVRASSLGRAKTRRQRSGN